MNFKRNERLFSIKPLLFFLVALNLLLFAVFLKNNTPQKSSTYPEITELTQKDMDFNQLKKYFTDLANKKGAVYAYQVLRIAPIKANIDMHLMGHVVGDVLYKQMGAKGMEYCTQDFRNACSHTIVVGLLLDKGEKALREIDDACKKAPGGSGAYSMCYHGLGHGVLAYTNYDLPKAVELCKKVGAQSKAGREFAECVGGTIMEIITGGDHDKLTWEKQRPKYLKNDDPLSPCLTNYISDPGARYMCLNYLTPHLFEVAGANLANPVNKDFKKAFTYCDALPQNNIAERKACFGGFGKEFIVLAKARDIRNIGESSIEELTKTYNWCLLAANSDGIKYCNSSAVSSLYWGGENNPSASINFCNIVKDPDAQKACFDTFFGNVSYYIRDSDKKDAVCKLVPERYQNQCQTRIQVK